MVEVTQEDREAVRAFHAKALGLAISGNEANRLLTEAFAHHRIAAENAAQQEITASQVVRRWRAMPKLRGLDPRWPMARLKAGAGVDYPAIEVSRIA